MTDRSFIEKMRDIFYSLGRSTLIPGTLADEMIDIYVSLSPSDHLYKGRVMTAREWALMVAYDTARMYNVVWEPTPDDLRNMQF